MAMTGNIGMFVPAITANYLKTDPISPPLFDCLWESEVYGCVVCFLR